MLKRLASILVASAVASIVVGCTERTSPEREILTSEDFPGAGQLEDAGTAPSIPDRVRSLCSPGTSVCVGENSPVIDRCSSDGESLERDACPSGEVCRNRRCVPFACEPGTSLCIGNTRAQCDPTGLAVEETEPCDGASVCEGGRCVDLCEQAVETGSYIGCEYVALRLPNFYEIEREPDDFPFGIVVANPHPFAPATVSMTQRGNPVPLWEPRELQDASGRPVDIGSQIRFADGTTEPVRSADEVVVPPGGAAVVLPSADVTLVRIGSNRPVTAYQFSPYCCNSTYTNDASLLFPVSTWGARYRATGYPYFASLGSPYVALYSSTNQTVALEAPFAIDVDGVRLTQGSITLEPGKVRYVTVNAEEALSGGAPNPRGDLSGVEITGEQPLAAFSGHPCTFVPEELAACDHLEEQLPPAETLGRTYLLTPIRQRARPPVDPGDEGVYWRVTADEDAVVSFDPPLSELDLLPAANPYTRSCSDLLADGVISLAEGETCAFGSLDAVGVESTGDVTVAGTISGQQSTGLSSFGSAAGDPAFFVLPASAQFRRDYSFIAPPTYALNFVSIATRVGEAVVLDGRNIEEEFRLQRQAVEVAGERWELFTVPIEPGLHTMRSERPFGIMVYAYDDYVSYAFVGGLDLLPKGSQ